ncbi:MAG: nucleotidyltransferase domain-containing protein [Promethearchaeota archaeon]
MPREKVTRTMDVEEVTYDDDHWSLLGELRGRGREVHEVLGSRNIPSLLYGSIARGDVKPTSDVDAFVPVPVPSFLLESALEAGGLQVLSREIVQATPGDFIKGHLYLPGDVCVTFPLSGFKEKNLEFYKFGGALEGPDFGVENRVPGANKRLELIIPTPTGHKRASLLDDPPGAAKVIGVGWRIVEERIRVLRRRDRVGRTGVFLKVTVGPRESFEHVLKVVADRNPLVRKKIHQQ